ncbi:hypothetical protein, partial [Microbacterium sp. Bi128]|uniref:hypothetical protein n=1 Tax=Microbacterium sp. Bi128 TaxID=2821115 RepID=UPI001E535995
LAAFEGAAATRPPPAARAKAASEASPRPNQNVSGLGRELRRCLRGVRATDVSFGFDALRLAWLNIVASH